MAWRCHIQYNLYSDAHDLFLRDDSTALTGLAFSSVDHGQPLNGVTVKREMLQSILNELWSAGFRPDGYGDIKESFKAKDEHLRDMRQIVFHKLGIK